jgi:hypothetical protein
MGSRGWILQERLLSPAILHFGNTQLYWECRGVSLSEEMPNYNSGGGNILHNLIGRAHHDHFLQWYELLAQYSKMSLTLESDRLPTIAGLATRFRRNFRSTYLVGLWLEDVHRGLLWHPVYDSSFRASQSAAVAPSWSWVSFPGAVIVDLPRKNAPENHNDGRPFDNVWDFSLVPLNRIYSDMDMDVAHIDVRKCQSLGRSAVKGNLYIWGSIVRVSCVTQDHVSFYIKRRSREEEVLCYMDHPHLLALPYYCLIIGTWSFSQLATRNMSDPRNKNEAFQCFLLLHRVQKPQRNAHPQDLGVFKRVGMGGARPDIMNGFMGKDRVRRFITLL